MRYFPVFVHLTNSQTVLVFGGGSDALCKIRLLMKTDVAINVIAPELNDELTELVRTGRIVWSATEFHAEQLTNRVRAIFVASGEPVATNVSAAATELGIAVNVVDRPDLSSFIVPAIVDRDPLVVAIGTEGAGPVLAQALRARIEVVLPPSIGGLLQRAAALRPAISRRVPAGTARRTFWHEFFFGRVREAYLLGNEQRYKRELDRTIAYATHRTAAGRISLINVCHDPELLTLKAHRLLQEADIILHDRAVATGVMEYARRDARRIVVQQSVWSSTDTDHQQTVLNALEEAASGQNVVRLFDGATAALDAELAKLRDLNKFGIDVDCVRGGVEEDCTWAPLIDGVRDPEDSTTAWRFAS